MSIRKTSLKARRRKKCEPRPGATMIATMEADPTKGYNQDDATGFIRLNALQLKAATKVQRKK